MQLLLISRYYTFFKTQILYKTEFSVLGILYKLGLLELRHSVDEMLGKNLNTDLKKCMKTFITP